MAVILIVALMVMDSLSTVTASKEMEEMFEHSGACSTQHGKEENDPNYFSSNSNIPNLPSASGMMGTHGTYRFLTVHEQVALLIGEGKHGMWRVQHAGYIRVYRTEGKDGIKEKYKDDALDGDDDDLNDILDRHYTHLDGNNRDHKHSFGEEISDEGWLNWLDLSIYHPKFEGKYDDHPAIDLPWYYCQLSSADFPHMENVWKYVKAQKNANKVGKLGTRAGMDINENFNSIVQFEMFGEGGVYANVGQGDEATDKMQQTFDELKSRAQTVHYKRIDDSKIKSEYYLFERGYHNYPEVYLIVGLVMDSVVEPQDYSYIRPDGRYYDGMLARGLTPLNTEFKLDPPVYIRDEEEKQTVWGLATYGHNHPVRHLHGLYGGACPTKGGDCSTYPWGNSGGGYPTDYEEITPICDGFLLDLKLWADLDKSWDSEESWLGNAGFGTQSVEYFAHANKYGQFEDPYLVEAGYENTQEVDFTEDGNVVMEAPEKLEDHPLVGFAIDFGMVGEVVEFVEVEMDPLPKGCAADEATAKDDEERQRYSSAERIRTAFGGIFLLLVYYCA